VFHAVTSQKPRFTEATNANSNQRESHFLWSDKNTARLHSVTAWRRWRWTRV